MLGHSIALANGPCAQADSRNTRAGKMRAGLEARADTGSNYKMEPIVAQACTQCSLTTTLLKLLGCFATGLLLCIMGPLPKVAAAEDGTVKAQYGDWQVVCKPPPPGAKGEVCALVQSVTAEDRSNVGLTVYFQKFSNGTRVLRVFAPLGILLPPGLGLKVDDKDVGNAPFLRCHNFACYAQVVAEDKLIEQLKTGKTAIFIIFQTEEAGIGIPISLAGFAQALNALN
jgi:invasion protein IalB